MPLFGRVVRLGVDESCCVLPLPTPTLLSDYPYVVPRHQLGNGLVSSMAIIGFTFLTVF